MEELLFESLKLTLNIDVDMQPKLSIITINFNNLEGLKKTAKSVINQTWKEFEWIIIDGGSTDGSVASFI